MTDAAGPDRRRLLVLRHAEAEHFATAGRDIDRLLTQRGHDQARAVGDELVTEGVTVVVALCSPATRTRETLESVRSAGDLGPMEISYVDAVYDAGSDTLRDLLADLPDDVPSALLVGHAPGVGRLVADLAESAGYAGQPSDPDALEALDRGFPTAALAELSLVGRWSSLAEVGARLDRLRWH